MTRRLLAAASAAALAVLAVLLTASPAAAAVVRVSLTSSGPSPATVTVHVGDVVAFTNNDSVTHALRSTSSNWKLSASVAPKTTKSVTFSAAGTFDYSDTYPGLLGISQTATGRVVVPTPAPSPTRAPVSASPRPAQTSSPRASAAPATPAVTAAPTQSGVALPPPIVGGVVPTPVPTTTAAPAPVVAAGSPTPSATGAAAQVDYADPSEIRQSSSHGFGLPAALAVVAAVGVLTLLVRILLSAPEARAPRAEPDVR